MTSDDDDDAISLLSDCVFPGVLYQPGFASAAPPD